jgi:MFS family permease
MILFSLAVDNVSGQTRPWRQIAAPAGAGTLCLLFYLLHARHSPSPLFRLKIFRIRNFSVGILGNIFSRLANGGMPFLTPLLLQVIMGYSPFHAGLIMIPLTAAAIFSKTVAAPLLDRFGHRTVLVTNTMLLGLFIAGFALLSPRTPLPLLLALFLLFGAINSLQFTALNTVTLIDLPGDEAGDGNSLLSVVMQISLSMGVAVSAALLALFMPEGSASGVPLLRAFRLTYCCMGGFAVLSSTIFLFLAGKAGAEIAPRRIAD